MRRDSKSKAPPGSPRWWLNQPNRAIESRGPGRPAISFDKIIATALDAVDEVGTDAFNMRMLAERLGSSTATLYRHVASKAEILAYVVDRVLGDEAVDVDAIGRSSWQKAISDVFEAFYLVLRTHPNVVHLVASRVPMGPNSLRIREISLQVFIRSGFPPQLAAHAFTSIAHYVIGFAIQQRATGASESEEITERGRFYRRLDKKTFPATLKAAEHLSSLSVEDEFHFGLKLIIDGVALAKRATGRMRTSA